MFGNVKIRLETLMHKAFDGNRKTALREKPIARNDPDKPRETGTGAGRENRTKAEAPRPKRGLGRRENRGRRETFSCDPMPSPNQAAGLT